MLIMPKAPDIGIFIQKISAFGIDILCLNYIVSIDLLKKW